MPFGVRNLNFYYGNHTALTLYRLSVEYDMIADKTRNKRGYPAEPANNTLNTLPRSHICSLYFTSHILVSSTTLNHITFTSLQVDNLLGFAPRRRDTH